MQTYTDFSIATLSGLSWLVWLVLAALIVLSIWLYRKTTPPLPVYWRIILAGLRVTAVTILCVALLEPVINLSGDYERPRRGLVLIDNSSSMDREEDSKARLERVDSLLSSTDFKFVSSNAELTKYYFDGLLSQTKDQTNRDRTALGDAISELKSQELTNPYDFWLLFSDGNFNSGQDPRQAVEGSGSKIHAVNMAGTQTALDGSINSVDYDPIIFAGESTPIEVRLSWQAAQGKSLKVKLLEAGRVLTEKVIKTDQADGLGEVTLPYIPSKPGRSVLSIEIEKLTGENNLENNRRSVSLKVLKSKIEILLYSDNPDYEVGFLKRFITSSDRYQVTFVSAGSKSGNLAGSFPGQLTELNRYDLVILHDPKPRRLQPHAQNIESYLSDRGGALFVLMGKNFVNSGTALWMNSLLPFYPSPGTRLLNREFHGEPSEENLMHPSVRLAGDQKSIRKAWAELPPFTRLVPCRQSEPTATVLAYASFARGQSGQLPVLGYRRSGPGKVMAMAASPLWKWGFGAPGYLSGYDSYRQFLEGTLEWLTVKEDLDPIRVQPEKDLFTRGEPVGFEGFAYDLGFRPIPGVGIRINLESSSDGETREIDMLSGGEGKYRAKFENVPPGQYDFEALVEKDNKLLKKINGKLRIESYSLEAFDQENGPENLRALARLTSGSYTAYDEFNKILDKLNLQKVSYSRTSEIVVWGRGWLLIVMIAALSLEWLIRKINQML